MQGLRILGVDPALRNTGLALMLYAPGSPLDLLDLKLIETKPSKKKRGLRAKSDDLRCLGIIRDEIDVVARTWGYDVVAFEECPGGGLGKIAIRKVGQAWGLSWGILTNRRGVLSFEYSPSELKKAITGRARASKAEMVEAVEQRHLPFQNFEVEESKKEHLADAVAAGTLAAQDDAVIVLARSLERLE